MLLIDKAGEIIKQVQDDGSWGVHAFNYTKQRVETAQAYLTKAQSIIDQGGYGCKSNEVTTKISVT